MSILDDISLKNMVVLARGLRLCYEINILQQPDLLSLSLFIQVSEELIRVAILWHEMWHEGLEEASRLYFGERNVKGMFAVLEPLHAMMERGPQTLKETSFNQAGVRFLQSALWIFPLMFSMFSGS